MTTIAPRYYDFRDCLDRPLSKGTVVLIRENEIAPVVVGTIINCNQPWVDEESGTVYDEASVTVQTANGRFVHPHPTKVLGIAPGAVSKLKPIEESEGE